MKLHACIYLILKKIYGIANVIIATYITSYTISASNHVPCSLEDFFDNSDVLRNGFGHFFHSIGMIKYLFTYIFNYTYIATCKLRTVY